MNTELILKELESAYERKAMAFTKEMTNEERMEALSKGQFSIADPSGEIKYWYEIIKFDADKARKQAKASLLKEYRDLRVEVLISGTTEAVCNFLLS